MKTASLRTNKGIIEVELLLKDGFITKVKITGDFFIYPEEALERIEKILIGSTGEKDDIQAKFKKIYDEMNIKTPGITIDDWFTVIHNALIS